MEKSLIFEDLVIRIIPTLHGIIYRDKGKCFSYFRDIDPATFKSELLYYVNESLIQGPALYEATAGGEDYHAILDDVARIWGIDRSLIKVKGA